VPLLARLVLGAAFISAGFTKIFREAEFNQAEVDALAAAHVDNVQPWSIHFASAQAQDPPPPPSGAGQDIEEGDALDEAGDAVREAAGDLQDDIEGNTGVDPDDVVTSEGKVMKKSLYGVAIHLNGSGFKSFPISPVWLAWATALTELIGGVLILIGLFSRVWGLGLAIIMGVAFYTTTLMGDEGLLASGLSYLITDTGLNMEHFPGMFLQLSLFVLAFGVFLTGGGAMSLDRMLFRGGRDEDAIDVDLT